MSDRTDADQMASQIIDLWDRRTNEGFPFLAMAEDVEPMRQILEGRKASNDLYAQMDRLADELRAEGHTEAADRIDALL